LIGVLREKQPYVRLVSMQYGKPHSVWLSLGTNLTEREENLRNAVSALKTRDGIRMVTQSDWFDTEPWGNADQPAFLNMAVEIETDLSPLELLNAVKSIERAMGRVPGTRWGPRLIDIDIVLYEDRVLETPELTVPHTRFRERAFVLEPLAQIAGQVIDPVSRATVADLNARVDSAGTVRRTTPTLHIGSD
jgi:2-amino-4-hydroxy-6-hydroxymethyldihydropteridine diphosphokinase